MERRNPKFVLWLVSQRQVPRADERGQGDGAPGRMPRRGSDPDRHGGDARQGLTRASRRQSGDRPADALEFRPPVRRMGVRIGRGPRQVRAPEVVALHQPQVDSGRKVHRFADERPTVPAGGPEAQRRRSRGVSVEIRI